jgi:hypothetical protein
MHSADVRNILWKTWDPLGLRTWAKVPHEYDDCITDVLNLLESDPTESEVASTLNLLFVTHIGCGVLPTPIKKSARAAKMLLNLINRNDVRDNGLI